MRHRPTDSDQAESEIGVVALVPDSWGPRWATRHHTLSRLAKEFPVVWMNPPHGLRGIPAHLARSRTESHPAPVESLHVYTTPWWLPQMYRPEWLARALFRQRLASARSWLRSRGCSRLVCSVWRPDYAGAFELHDWWLRCYHVDDEYTFSPTERPVPEGEVRVLEQADRVFFASEALFERKSGYNASSHLTPNGVDYGLYSSTCAEPGDLATVPRPRIGFTGYLKRQLDWTLFHQIASRNPSWQLVLVGPFWAHPEIQAEHERLMALPNVHHLGAKSTRELGAYPQHFDVCIMPYRVNAYTKYICPLKLHEYLASGRPVVGARLPAVEPYEDVVRLAEDVTEWEQAIQASLEPESTEAPIVEARQRVAARFDWDHLVRTLAEMIRSGPPPGSRDRASLVESSEI